MSKKIIFVIIIFVVLLCIAGFLIYRQSTFSPQILSVNISGPATATVGDEITYTITYKNNSNNILQNPELIFDMPENSLTEDGKTRIIQDLKDLTPGAQSSVDIKTRLLGKEGDMKVAKAALSYTPKNLTVVYETDANFTTQLSAVPITLGFDLPSAIGHGKNLQYTVNYLSNVNYPLENLSIKITPVNGFNFTSANPTSLDNTEWKLPTLTSGQGGSITINGNVSADVNQQLTFSASLGMWQNGSFIVIQQTTQNVQVIPPDIVVSQQVNDADSYTAAPGGTLHYQIFFRNIGSSPFQNLSLSVKLDTANLDTSTIQANGGQVQQNGTVIVWNQDSLNQLKYLGPQNQGEVDFSVNVKSASALSSTNFNPVVNDEVDVAQTAQSFSIKVDPSLSTPQ